ncbi:homeobox protein HAT3.1 [Cornus florida]|uniref:homeobox protein HAT3.1 n=1 Tax=Cornus florida TaxID=4283 RepID=UPI00289F0DD9|nr:homeobox protein HAT3.1 [Cornus florida]XP_059647856.1 homeobox protein HAT3.1 [Cornus florida]XP_059647857.1 homeobox protein HAT3.1 [Cornus florida]XP_059647858.1 homeobox protein HAT3.1 [Cornus florida]
MSMEVSTTRESSEAEKISSPKRTMSELNNEFSWRSVCSEPLEQKVDIANENVPNGPAKTATTEFNCVGIEQLRPVPEELTTNSSREQLKSAAEDATMDSNLGQFELLPKDAIGGIPTPKQTTSELIPEFGSESLQSESVEQKQVIGSEDFQNRQAETRMADSDCMDVEQSGLPPEHVTGSSMQPDVEQSGMPSEHATGNSSCEQLRSPPQDAAMKSCLEQLGSPEDAAMNSNLERLGHPPDSASQNPCLEQIGSSLPDADKNPCELEHRDKRTSAKSRKGKYAVSPSVGCNRVLRSRSQEKPKAQEPVNTLAEHGANEETKKKKKKKKKKRQEKRTTVNEFKRIRNHLRYLLCRMSYEQNLIVVYSGEGWKGQSLEKVKPEKELERAKSDIFRLKLKIRDLFQRLDQSFAEGRLPKSLFDSEGEIDSEDIFCAKCGSKETSVDNDIILCDGACERGFHQFCLEPPLLKEDIPPDDEGWLCPGCDCKVDCIDLLNESQGTDLSITDGPEKVYPEAAAGNKLDDASGFPSDDSQDDDYDPDGAEVDENVQGDESSSEGSEFYSASDDFRASPDNGKYLGLPSDDSEDDDYDPSAPDLDEQVKHESSSSDFTSDTEDFSDAVEENRSSLDQLRSSGGSDVERSKLEGTKEHPLNDELFSLLESNPGQNDSATISRKRHVERLDYKKLHDETYGHVSSDSSDEDWMDTASPKKVKNNSGDVALVSLNGKTPLVKNSAEGTKYNQEESEHTPKRRASKRLSVEGSNNSPATSNRGSSQPGSGGKSSSRSYKKLGDTASQILINSFKENQYPERAMKENLAKESGLTLKQVSKWFENARWSFRHPSQMDSSTVKSTPNKGSPSPKKGTVKSPSAIRVSNGDAREVIKESSIQKSTTPRGRKKKAKLDHQAIDHMSIEETSEQAKAREAGKSSREVIKESSIQKSTTPRTRSRKAKLDNQVIDQASIEETPGQSVPVGSSKAQGVGQSNRTKGRKRKSVS